METVAETIDLDGLLIEAGLKGAATSSEVVVAPNGTSALLYFADPAGALVGRGGAVSRNPGLGRAHFCRPGLGRGRPADGFPDADCGDAQARRPHQSARRAGPQPRRARRARAQGRHRLRPARRPRQKRAEPIPLRRRRQLRPRPPSRPILADRHRPDRAAPPRPVPRPEWTAEHCLFVEVSNSTTRWAQNSTICCRTPFATASARDAAPSFRNSDSMWNLTVWGEMPRSRAISLLVMPLPRAPRTSISRGVNRTGGSSGNDVEISSRCRLRTYRQPRCDGAQRGIDLSRAGVGRKPTGKLSASGADRDRRSRQTGIGGAVGQDRIGRRGRLHQLMPALCDERGEAVLRRRVGRHHGNAKPVGDPSRRGAHLSGRTPTATAIENGLSARIICSSTSFPTESGPR